MKIKYSIYKIHYQHPFLYLCFWFANKVYSILLHTVGAYIHVPVPWYFNELTCWF